MPKNLTAEGRVHYARLMVVHDMMIGSGELKAGEDARTAYHTEVGVAARQTAKRWAPRCSGTSGFGRKLAKLKAMGLDVGIRTRDGRFRDAVMKATGGGKGANLVVNNVGGSVLPRPLRRSHKRAERDQRLRGRRPEERDRSRDAAQQRLTLFGVSKPPGTPEQSAGDRSRPR